jgi:hypothetical protein
MQFSDTTNKLGIIQACERYTNLGDASISGVTALLKEFTAHANVTSSKIWSLIFNSYGGWIYDDSNQTNLPQAADNLVSGTKVYALPSEALVVNRLEVKDSNGTFVKVEPFTQEMVGDQGLSEFMKTNGTPQYYRLIGNTIELYPTPNYASTGGLKVYFDREAVAFASTDTTKTPGFTSAYHNAVAVGAAIEWMKVKQPASAVLKNLYMDWQGYEASIAEFYASRWRDLKPKVKPRANNWR